MNRNMNVAAAVAAVLASSGALATPPLLSDVQSAPNVLYVSGSSAIKVALTNSILKNFCGEASTTGPFDHTTVITTASGSNGNFLGIACTPTRSLVSHDGVYDVWIRYEGGSVSGFLPIVNSSNPINFIDKAHIQSLSPTVLGSSAVNGTNDSFSGEVGRHVPDLGIGDVEPAALIGSNYPADYTTSIWGASNANGLFNLRSSPIVDEVYALYVNENSTAFTEHNLKLSQETIAAILTHIQVTNWSQVLDINGNAVVSAPLAITVVNREQGSGSRAATDILLVGDKCGSAGAATTLFNKGGEGPSGAQKYFATGDVLKAAHSVAGAITYATIDNTEKVDGSAAASNLEWVYINGVAPSNLAAAQGNYPFWVEAQYVNNASFNSDDSTAVNSIVGGLQSLASTASLADVNVIPNVVAADSATNGGTTNYNTVVHIDPTQAGASNSSPSGGGTNSNGSSSTVYINPYTRGGITCHNPIYAGTTAP